MQACGTIQHTLAVLQAAEPAGHRQTLLLQTCTLLGCFVAPEGYVPVLLAALCNPDASLKGCLSQLQVLCALLNGSGGPQTA